MDWNPTISRTTHAYENFHAKLYGMFCHSPSNTNQLFEALNEVLTSTYTKMSLTTVHNFRVGH